MVINNLTAVIESTIIEQALIEVFFICSIIISMDGVKVALGNRGMMVEAARKNGKSGEPWYICN